MDKSSTVSWLEMMRQEARRTDLEITDSVKRMYWGSVLARQLNQLAGDTLARMEGLDGHAWEKTCCLDIGFLPISYLCSRNQQCAEKFK
jgi:hypothetical protein